ncbi:MAG: GDP-mannose 4,6-dehydratase [Deltaproteobacteria bacterium RBG_16_50_11]|nr:MAG: GDP-mannose 4,6-dehydratase [Deltaproteobacteria bacterium RBG_16_50_11]
MKRALITGINGQVGSYLAEFLLGKGYEVWGMYRRSSTPKFQNISQIIHKMNLVEGDLLDVGSLYRVLKESQPDEVYNLAALAHVGVSWHQPALTGEINGLGVVNLLDAIVQVKPDAKFYQASSSELFGSTEEDPKNEATPMYPVSPYGVAKLYAHKMVRSYRDVHNLFAVGGICFNMDSPRRGEDSASRKIAKGAARIKLGLEKDLHMGNLASIRDWGFAGDYVEAMWLMLQQEEPEDFVVATGVGHSVKEFCQAAFSKVGLDWEKYVKVDSGLLRPVDVSPMTGDASRIGKKLGWKPKTSFEELVGIMVDAELSAARN